MTEKSKELNASITLINDKLHFKATAGENQSIILHLLAITWVTLPWSFCF
jgi:hypothetical protein